MVKVVIGWPHLIWGGAAETERGRKRVAGCGPQSCKMMLGPDCRWGLYLWTSLSEPSPHPRLSPWRTSAVTNLQRLAPKMYLLINLSPSRRPRWVSQELDFVFPIVGPFPLPSHKDTGTETWTGTPWAFRAFFSSTSPIRWILGHPGVEAPFLYLCSSARFTLFPGSL